MTNITRIRELLLADNKASFIEACDLVSRIDSDTELDVVLAEFPAMADYDAKGNWVGSVANENGWTP